jgi:Xaa-Pro aminopeptidase
MYHAHREKFLSKLAPNSVAILRSAPTRTFSNDTEYAYRQDSDFHYLTGFDEPDSVAVFRPNAPDGKRYLLYVRAHDARREAYDGTRPGPEGAVAEYGADAAYPISDFLPSLSRYEATTRSFSGHLSGVVETVYLADAGDAAWADKVRGAMDPMRARDSGPSTVVDARELIHEMRLVKDADEIIALRRASEISARGHIQAMKTAAPNRWEFEIQQALDGYCLANGAPRMAYPSIVGSGPNSVFLHWYKNNRQLQVGDLVLNDSGAEYAYYAADVTRTYPASGRFTPEQKAIYDIVLAAQKEAIGEIRPGTPHEEVEKHSARVQADGLRQLGLLSGDLEKIIADRAYVKFTVHGVSHWVGLDVHDVGKYRIGTESRKLEPGMVLTVEPGIYIPAHMAGVDPKWWNIGVRIEDVLLVTPTGSECLSCAAPRELVEVEKTVQAGRK